MNAFADNHAESATTKSTITLSDLGTGKYGIRVQDNAAKGTAASDNANNDYVPIFSYTGEGPTSFPPLGATATSTSSKASSTSTGSSDSTTATDSSSSSSATTSANTTTSASKTTSTSASSTFSPNHMRLASAAR